MCVCVCVCVCQCVCVSLSLSLTHCSLVFCRCFFVSFRFVFAFVLLVSLFVISSFRDETALSRIWNSAYSSENVLGWQVEKQHDPKLPLLEFSVEG